MKNTGFQTTITSEHKLMDLHIKETFRYRDLIFLFVKRDFTAMYKQTVLGPLWAIIQPLLTTLVFTVIFGKLAKLTTADAPGEILLPGFLFYMAGNICWSLFSTTVEATSNTFPTPYLWLVWQAGRKACMVTSQSTRGAGQGRAGEGWGEDRGGRCLGLRGEGVTP